MHAAIIHRLELSHNRNLTVTMSKWHCWRKTNVIFSFKGEIKLMRTTIVVAANLLSNPINHLACLVKLLDLKNPQFGARFSALSLI